jgi:hypothetical protein
MDGEKGKRRKVVIRITCVAASFWGRKTSCYAGYMKTG